MNFSYLDACMMNSCKVKRRRYLLENYLFHCRCERCEEEDSDETDSELESEEETEILEEDSFS